MKRIATSRALLPALIVAAWPLAHAQDAQQQSLPPIVVMGKKPADAAKKEIAAEQAATPGAVTLVDGEDLRERNVTSLADAAPTTPS